MKKGITVGLAFLLIAGAAQSVVAQEHDRKGHEGAPPNQDQRGPGPSPQPRNGPGGPPGGRAFSSGGSQNFHNEGGPGAGPQRHGFEGQGDAQRHGSEFGRTNREPGTQRFEQGTPPGPGASRRQEAPNGFGRSGHAEGLRGADRSGGARSGFEGRHEVPLAGSGVRTAASPWGGSPGAPAHWRAGRAPTVFWAHDRFRAGAYSQPYGYYSRAWAFGDFLPHGWYGRNYWIGNFIDYDLPYPPPGFEWVRVGGDAILVDQFTGRIVQVVRGIFW